MMKINPTELGAMIHEDGNFDNEVIQKDNGWYFWTEDEGEDPIGPFKTRDLAIFFLGKYCERFL